MIKQIIPSKICVSCDVCCRFLDSDSALRPIFLPHEITAKIKPQLDKSCRVKLQPWQDTHVCPFFNAKNHRCLIYSKRPFDCRLYPFTIMFDEKKERIILGADKKCLFVSIPENQNRIKDHLHYLSAILENKDTAALIAKNPLFIGEHQEDVIKFACLGNLSKLVINNPEKKGFRQISLKDKPLFDDFFKKSGGNHSGRTFVNLYIWKEKNPVWWKMNTDRRSDNLPDRRSGEVSLKILLETDFGYMDFNSLKKFPDYIYLTKAISELKGNKYKHKRSSCNYFSKHCKFQYLPYKTDMKKDCLKLFSRWAGSRRKKSRDLYYNQLLEDSFSAHKSAIENFKAIGLTGRVIKIKGKACGYTFGFPINEEMFCVLLEVCDLRFKGISEFIFREFCREMKQYKYINTMDDSGLENLRISKLSYHPVSTSLHF